MGIEQGRAHLLVAQQFLDGPDVRASLQAGRGKGVAQGMTAYRLEEASPLCGSATRALHYDFVQVMAPVCSGARINGNLGRWKPPLPAPFFGRSGIFPGQGVWQLHAAEAVGEVVLMQFPYSGELSEQRRFHGEGQHLYEAKTWRKFSRVNTRP